MPFSTNFSTIIPLISNARLSPYQNTFATTSDAELYGVYLWSQHAAGALYPLIQALEVTLRNAIDSAARNRFGDYWWDTIDCRVNKNQSEFYKKIEKAKRDLTKSWERKERVNLGLSSAQPLPQNTVRPTWSHDKIVAATDFSTWQFILNTDFAYDAAAHQKNPADFLWPVSLGKAFRKYNQLDAHADNARVKIVNIVDELRNYRNRLFHHEPIWIKDPSVVDPSSAINTIRAKINKLRTLLSVINPSKEKILERSGVLLNARRTCSIQELNIYVKETSGSFSKRQKKHLRKTLSSINLQSQTVTIEYAGNLFGLYKIR